MNKIRRHMILLLIICLFTGFTGGNAQNSDPDVIQLGKSFRITSDRLKLTITIDEKGQDLQSDTGYEVHAKAVYKLNEIWTNGLVGMGGSGYYYEKTCGSLADLTVGNILQFRYDKFEGRGKGWCGLEQETNTMILEDLKTWRHRCQNSDGDRLEFIPRNPNLVNATIKRTAKGATLYFLNLNVGDGGGGLQYPFIIENELEETLDFFSFTITEAELKGDQPVVKEFTRTITGITSPCKITYSAKMVLEEEKLKADFTVSGQKRGVITLDGSPSKGKIAEYRWSFKQKSGAEYPEGIQFNPDVEMTGQTIKLILLAPVEVTLRVKDEKGNVREKKIDLNIQAREWKTKFSHPSEEPEPLTTGNISLLDEDYRFSPKLQLGVNVCNRCKERNEAGSIYHPEGQGPPTNRTWDTIGYEIGYVTQGPFKGTYYTNSYSVVIERKSLVNYHLFDGSELSRFNQKKGEKNPVRRLFEARKKHERLHSVFLEEALQSNDPAPDLEQSFDRDYENLKKKLDAIMLQKEGPLDQALNDEERVRNKLRETYGTQRAIIEVPYGKNRFTTLYLYLYNFKEYQD